MIYFLLTLGLFALVMLIMAVGVIFSNRELKGSCGGPGRCACEIAGRPKSCDNPPPSIHTPASSTLP